MKITIAYLIPEFPGQTHAFFMRERAELKKRGVETQLISTRPPIAGAGLARHDWAIDVAKETIYLSPLSLFEIINTLWTLLMSGPLTWIRCLSVAFGSSDLKLAEKIKLVFFIVAGAQLKNICLKLNLKHVHVHSCANAAHVAMFSKLLNGPTYSLTLHGPLDDYGKNQQNKWMYASFCVVITKDLMAEVVERLNAKDLPRLYLAPMGVNIDDFKRTEAYHPCESSTEVKLVSCGRLNPCKGHDDLIRAVSTLKAKGIDVHLNICGAADSQSIKMGYDQTLISLTKEMNVETNVTFLGSVSEARVKSELQNSHFFCLASHKEPLGVVTMEAMSMEIPVIVARSPGVEEMINDKEDGLIFEPKVPEQIVDLIMQLINDPDAARRLSRNGRLKVKQQFHSGISAEKIQEGILLTYNQITN